MIPLYIIIFLTIIFSYMLFEASWVQVNDVYFSKESKCLRILHLSDIHTKFLLVSVKKIRRAIEKANPDIIMLTGDFIERPADVSSFLKKLQYIKSGYRTLLCFGNHDYTAFRHNPSKINSFIKELEAMQVEILTNRTIQIEKDQTRYNIIGIDDLVTGNPDIEKAMKSTFADSAVNIAISHNPDIIYEFYGHRIDYLFCGHFHGGQIWLPFNLESRLLRTEKTCKAGIRRGLHHLNGTALYISRGLGNVVVPLRLHSRPEITIYYLP